MKPRTYVVLGVAMAALIGAGSWLHGTAAPAANERRGLVSDPNEAREAVAPFEPWEKEAPAKPLDASQLDQYLAKVLARAQKYPATADDAHELALAVIAELMPGNDLGAIVLRQREFTGKMRIAAPSAPAHPPSLPDELKTILVEVRRAPSDSTRGELIQRYVQKAAELPGATQAEAIEQLREAASE